MSETPDFQVTGGPNRDSAIPRFYMKAVKNEFETQRQGRPIFRDVEYVEINVPGDRRTVVDRAVTDEHRRRWPREYEAFKAGQELPVEGTALEEWGGVTRSQVEELRPFKIRTVEQLAALSDDQLGKAVPMSGFSLREKAQRFLEQAKGAAPMEKLAAENEDLKASMQVRDDRIKALEEQVQKLLAAKDEK